MEIRLILFAVVCARCIVIGESVEDFIVNADSFEQNFHEEFLKYWEGSREITEHLAGILKTPNHPNVKLENLPDCRSPKQCLECRALSYSFLSYHQKYSEQNLTEYYIDLCEVVGKQRDYFCHGTANVYMPTIKYILKHRLNELSSDRICGILLQNNECSAKKNLIDFTVEVDRAPVNVITKSKEFGADASDSTPVLNIAHLSDFHYDPYYSAGSSSDCVDFVCCRNTSIPTENSTEKSGYWGDYHSCDSPGYLVQNILENMCAQLASNHKSIDVVYYTGDFVDHFEWLTTESHLKESIAFVTNQIKVHFPSVPVLMTIGNHDVHPSNAFAPSDLPNTITNDSVNSKWLYEFVADLWSAWLPEHSLITLRRGGYYSFALRQKLRIIVLNNNLCFTHNLWLLYGADSMKTQLEWLRDELILAESNDERVHILGHIPPNTATCIRAWNREYNKLIRKFAHIISGQFNGHTHNDEFTLFYAEDETAAVNVAWNGGSGTSFIGLNSNYRLYTVDAQTFDVLDHETWIFNLTEANLTPHKSPRWFKEYSFRDAYNVTDLKPATLSHLVHNVWKNDRSSLEKYSKYHSKMSDYMLTKGCDDNCLGTRRLEANGSIELNWF